MKRFSVEMWLSLIRVAYPSNGYSELVRTKIEFFRQTLL
jgi:hypothetical protein